MISPFSPSPSGKEHAMPHRIRNLKLTFTQKIILVTSVLILAMTLLITLSLWQLSSNTFSKLERKLLIRNVESIRSQLNTTLETVQNLTTQITRSPSLNTLSSLEPLHEETRVEANAQLTATMNTVISTSAASKTSSIQFINIYLKNGHSICSLSPEYLPYQSFADCVSTMETAGITVLDSYVPTCWFDAVSFQGNGISGHCLVGMRFLYEASTLEKIGVVVVGLKQSSLEHIFKNLPSSLFVVRSDGTIISATRSSSVGEAIPYMKDLLAYDSPGSSPIALLPDGSEAFLYRLSGGASWLVCPIEENMLDRDSAVSQYTEKAIYFTLMAVALTIFLSWFSSKTLTKSLVRLKSMVQKVNEGDLSARFETDQHDEIAYLGVKINEMLEQVENFYRTQERDAAEKQNLELQLMQSQINPHLLYNTLNSALWIIRQKDMEKAENLILSLGNFFKLALSKGNQEIPLSNEIAMIQYYLKIQNLGRGKAFHLEDQVPEEWRGFKVLRLTLQPLVENAVIHGFSDWRDDGQVTISVLAEEDQQRLTIFVEDNGIGILPEDLDALREHLRTYPPMKEHKHYGLYNVEHRIKNKYGKEYGLALESEVGDYTKITLALPLHKEISHD
ncbi:MAG: sensor histidine kinase [Lachnospiraceae bacterium]|nr:sensor histidine kinase [Lachnospiraceae bacterium]